MNDDLSDRCRSPNLTLARARLRPECPPLGTTRRPVPGSAAIQGDVEDVIDVGVTRLVRQAASRRRPACGWCNSKAPRSLLACGVASASCSRAAARLARWHPAHAPRWVSCSRQCASLIVGVCLMGHTPWFVCVSDRPGGAEVQPIAAHITTPRLPPVFPWSATQHCARAHARCPVDLRADQLWSARRGREHHPLRVMLLRDDRRKLTASDNALRGATSRCH